MGLLTLLAMLACPGSAHVAGFDVETHPGHRVADLPVTVVLTAVDADGERVEDFCGSVDVSGLSRGGVERKPLAHLGPFVGGRLEIPDVVWDEGFNLREQGPGSSRSWWIAPDIPRIPGFLSIIPPLFAIVLAIWLRQALIALLSGIWLGALFINNYNPLTALLRTVDTHLPGAIAEPDHAAIVVFTLALGGMVGILSRAGSTRALVDVVAERARTRRSGMLASWLSGMVVFFDDYANCLLVGNTMRPLTDRLRISREKLSFIVDATAAPVATIAVVSTWIGYELGLFQASIPGSPYDTFLHLLPYRFYSFFTIAFVAMIAGSGRDFGPMLRAERRAWETGKVLRDGATPLVDRELTDMDRAASGGSPIDAVLGIGAVIVIVFVGLYLSGRAELGRPGSLREVIAAANSYAVLLWAAFGGSFVALGSALWGKRLTFSAGLEAWVSGCKAMVMAVFILVLAWGLGDLCRTQLLTGPWVLSQIHPDPRWIPFLTFFVSAFVSFSTGSSFSTMAIVIPIAGPLAWALTGDAGIDPAALEGIRYGTLAAVLSGAVFGDHCSPISDTTIMSSMASAADHVDHVRTQLPYAGLCAVVSGVFGFGPAGFGAPWWVSLVLGVAALGAVVWWLGERVERPGPPPWSRDYDEEE